MTANELLTLLGRAWSRLLIYPGGLAAFGLLWLIGIFQIWRTGKLEATKGERPTTNPRSAGMRHSSFVLDQIDQYSSIVPPWLALALLPLPLAVALPRQIDIVLALALLEWPNLLAIRQALRLGGARRLAATLNSYPTLILAVLALAQASGSLEIAALARPPDSLATTATTALHWLGAIALALALPPALAIGPFAGEGRPTTDDRRPTMTKDEGRPTTDEGRPTTDEGRRTTDEGRRTTDEALSQPLTPNPQPPILGLRLRGLGLVALAALPWAGAEGTAATLLRMLGAAAIIAALLWGYDQLTRGQAARRWARAYVALDTALLLALLWAAYQALQSRLA